MNKRIKTNRINPLRVHPDNMPSMYTRKGVTVLNICSVMDVMYESVQWPDYEQRCKDLKAYCDRYNVDYYGSPRETYFEAQAILDAQDKGCVFVIVEDLS